MTQRDSLWYSGGRNFIVVRGKAAPHESIKRCNNFLSSIELNLGFLHPKLTNKAAVGRRTLSG